MRICMWCITKTVLSNGFENIYFGFIFRPWIKQQHFHIPTRTCTFAELKCKNAVGAKKLNDCHKSSEKTKKETTTTTNKTKTNKLANKQTNTPTTLSSQPHSYPIVFLLRNDDTTVMCTATGLDFGWFRLYTVSI